MQQYLDSGKAAAVEGAVCRFCRAVKQVYGLYNWQVLVAPAVLLHTSSWIPPFWLLCQKNSRQRIVICSATVGFPVFLQLLPWELAGRDSTCTVTS